MLTSSKMKEKTTEWSRVFSTTSYRKPKEFTENYGKQEDGTYHKIVGFWYSSTMPSIVSTEERYELEDLISEIKKGGTQKDVKEHLKRAFRLSKSYNVPLFMKVIKTSKKNFTLKSVCVNPFRDDLSGLKEVKPFADDSIQEKIQLRKTHFHKTPVVNGYLNGSSVFGRNGRRVERIYCCDSLDNTIVDCKVTGFNINKIYMDIITEMVFQMEAYYMDDDSEIIQIIRELGLEKQGMSLLGAGVVTLLPSEKDIYIDLAVHNVVKLEKLEEIAKLFHLTLEIDYIV